MLLETIVHRTTSPLIILCFFPLSFNVGYSTAQNNLGMAYYGMMSSRWPCEESLKVFDNIPVPRISTLYNTFGDDWSCIDRFLSLPGRKVFEIHLINDVCPKYPRCGNYEFFAGQKTRDSTKLILKENPQFFRRFEEYAVSIKNHLDPFCSGDTECLISPFLESPRSDEEGRIIVEKTRNIFADTKYKILWSPLSPKTAASADFLEGHGGAPPVNPPCIVSLDGTDISEVDVDSYGKRFAECHSNFLWTYTFNLLLPKEGWKDPRERTTVPSTEEFKSLHELLVRYLK